MQSRNSDGGVGADITDRSKEASTLADKAKAQVTEAVEPVIQEARATAERQKDYGANRIEGLAQAVHGAADQLETELPQAADYVHHAASGLERVSSSLRERNVDQLMDSFGRFARSQPAAVFGGAIMAGIALSRFLKSSGHGTPR